MKAVHLTSVHSASDPRILQKQCRSLAAAGIEVVLVAPGDAGLDGAGVPIRSVPRPSSRLQRWIRTVPAVLRLARRERADIYHVHDPELLPAALVLRMAGARVIYDVHEDYVTAIRRKPYIPRALRGVLARSAGLAEKLAVSVLEVVIAERYYSERFPRATPVLNYPILEDWMASPSVFGAVPRLLYTGSISEDRGAFNHAQLLPFLPEFELHMVGRISHVLAQRLRAVAGTASDRLVVPFVDRYVPPGELRRYCLERRWLAGVALFPGNPHYQRKELTKFFEYMAMGLPVVATDFPVWDALLTDTGAGTTGRPDDPASCAGVVRALLQDPIRAGAMGAAGRRAVLDHYDWESQAKALVTLYRTGGS